MVAEFMSRLEAIARERCQASEPAHDFLHVRRVVENARRIAAAEGADLSVVVPAALLHELFNHPKNHPESHRSGEVCAEHAAAVLVEVGYPWHRIAPIAYCIQVHSFSLGVTPETLEAKVLQDADRLDSIGAIGIARCFATGTTMQRPFYAPSDPFCEKRMPNDQQWSLDHFYRKLLKIPATLHTATARRMGESRVRFLHQFLEQLRDELGADPSERAENPDMRSMADNASP